MRLKLSNDAYDNESLKKFAKGILDIEDGKLGCDNDGDAVVEILDDICINDFGNLMADIVSSTYPFLIEGMQDINLFQNRVVLAPTFDLVEKVNDCVMSFWRRQGVF